MNKMEKQVPTVGFRRTGRPQLKCRTVKRRIWEDAEDSGEWGWEIGGGWDGWH